MKHVGLVLEGGGQRGVFTSGVLDYMMERGLQLPYVIGVSAGACNAVDYVSGQIGRTKECMIDAQKEYGYINMKNFLKTGYLFDMDMAFDRYPNELVPFDFEAYKKSPIRCVMTATNCKTGMSAYIEEKTTVSGLWPHAALPQAFPLWPLWSMWTVILCWTAVFPIPYRLNTP